MKKLQNHAKIMPQSCQHDAKITPIRKSPLSQSCQHDAKIISKITPIRNHFKKLLAMPKIYFSISSQKQLNNLVFFHVFISFIFNVFQFLQFVDKTRNAKCETFAPPAPDLEKRQSQDAVTSFIAWARCSRMRFSMPSSPPGLRN